MIRGRFVYRKGQLVIKGGPDDIRSPVAVSSLPRPMIISDTLHDVVNPIDGRPYDSKSAYYRTVKDNGCSILGNETVTARDNDHGPDYEADVAQALNQLT